jgi:hypothetical protein
MRPARARCERQRERAIAIAVPDQRVAARPGCDDRLAVRAASSKIGIALAPAPSALPRRCRCAPSLAPTSSRSVGYPCAVRLA